MSIQKTVSRRRFMGGLAAFAGYCGLRPDLSLWGQSHSAPADLIERSRLPADQYDSVAKLAFNENPFGPSPAVLEAMTRAFKYANRYGYPDGGIADALAAHHGVGPENILVGAGSTEILEAAAAAFVPAHKRVLGVEPTFSTVFEFATGLDAEAIRLPLGADFRQDIPALVKAACDNRAELGLVYVCNPNNPTGAVVRKGEIKKLLEGVPENIPVLIDEAYHHFVEDPEYATSVPYVLEGRPVIIARTFSKIAALAGLRLGYAVAPPPLIRRMWLHVGNMQVSVLAKWAGVAALKDTAAQATVRTAILDLRKKTTSQLATLGFKVIPSETNFFMVDIRRPVGPVIQEFRRRQILVGRPFPPLSQHLRVSVGTADEMQRFLTAFKEIV
jgi:histidinol-phosphate aminotransferase